MKAHKMPTARKVTPDNETRIVIHTVVRDLLRVLAKRRGITMNRVVWEALQQYWFSNGYDEQELFQIVEPPSCPPDGFVPQKR